VHEIIYNNSNPYRTLVIDTMKMNQGYASQCSIINEEHNANTTRFFYLLKDFDDTLGFREIDKLISLGYHKIDMCPNFYILYYLKKYRVDQVQNMWACSL